MFEKTLPENAKDALAVLGENNLLKNAYLAGGTALAMQMGHRISVDLDFFTPKKFDERTLIQKFTGLPINFKLDSLSEGTILGYLNGTRFSLFFYKYPLLEKFGRFSGANIAGIKDIAPMKLSAISDRGTKRDFVDLYFIIAAEKKFTLSEIFGLYDIKFKVLRQNKLHILKSLVYFADAEEDPMPRMIKDVNWHEIKKFFEKEVKNISRKIL